MGRDTGIDFGIKIKEESKEESRESKMNRLIENGLLPMAKYAYSISDEYPIFKPQLYDMFNSQLLDIEKSKAHRYFNALDFAVKCGEKELKKRQKQTA